MIISVLLIIGIIYLIVSILVYFMANSNIIPNRRKKTYSINFNAELKYFDSALDNTKQVAYWVAKNDQAENNDKNVILLHGFTRTSKKLETRASIYWKLGYNLYFVDNLGHGYSSNLLYPSGYRYSIEVRKLIKIEKISSPVIHGLSMGAIAASVIAQLEPKTPKAIVCEALPYNFEKLYKELLRYLNIPYFLFPWIGWLSKKLNWSQFEKLGLDESDYQPEDVKCDFYLIHSNTDRLFDYQDHYEIIVNKFKGNEHFKHLLVKDGGHTRMVNDPNYEQNLLDFLEKID